MKQLQLFKTEDGSHSIRIPDLDETYHSRFGAVTESQHVYIRNGLHPVLDHVKAKVRVLEVGLGTGLNVLLTSPVSLAVDYMVWNVTKDEIRTRMASIDEDIWPLPSITEKLPADPKDKVGFSDFIIGGKVPYQDTVDNVYKSVNEEFGTNIPTPE